MTAMAIAANSTTSNLSLTGYANDLLAGSNSATHCALTDGLDRVFTLSVPAGNRLTVVVTPSATMDPALSLFTSLSECSTPGATCVASMDLHYEGDAESLSWINPSSSAMTVYLVVEGFTVATSAGTFALQADVRVTPPDDRCDGAIPLTSGVTRSNETIVGYSDDYPDTGTQCATSTSPDRAYAFTIPPHQRTTVTVIPSNTTDAVLNLVSGPASTCSLSPRECTEGTNYGSIGRTEILSHYNTSNTSQPYFALVDVSAGGSFSIVATTTTPIANDTCATSNITLVNGSMRTDSLQNMEPDYGLNMDCGSFQGPDRVYRVAVSPGQTLTVVVTPSSTTGGFRPIVTLLSGDGDQPRDRFCEGKVTATNANQPVTFTWTSNFSSTVDGYLVVADVSTTSTDRTFTLATTITPP